MLGKDAPNDILQLRWTGGTAPYTVYKSPLPFGFAPLASGVTTMGYDDPTLFDGHNACYLVD